MSMLRKPYHVARTMDRRLGRATSLLTIVFAALLLLIVFPPRYTHSHHAPPSLNYQNGDEKTRPSEIEWNEVEEAKPGELFLDIEESSDRSRAHPPDESLLPAHLHTYLNDPSASPYAPPARKAEDPEDVKLKVTHRTHNHKYLAALGECLSTGTCVKQDTVVLFGSGWVRQGVVDGWSGGEGVWGRSMYYTCVALGYTCLMGESNYTETLWQYRLFPDLVKVIIQHDTGACQKNAECVYSAELPDGVPAWKLFDMAFFPFSVPSSIMKGPWIVNADIPNEFPQNHRNQTFLGYSVEEEAMDHPFIAPEDREGRAWVFAKVLRYFYWGKHAWPVDFYERLEAEPSLKLNFAGGYIIEHGWSKDKIVKGITNLGQTNARRFVDIISHSNVLLGVGDPLLSPTPYVALGQGVPFINPRFKFDPKDPDNCAKWEVQHQSLRCEKEPYVYHVQEGDYDGLLRALKLAHENPIGRYFLPWATQQALTERFVTFVHVNWKDEARSLLDRRIERNAPKDQLFYM